MSRHGPIDRPFLARARRGAAVALSLLVLGLTGLGAASAAGAQDFVVIVHADNPQSSLERKFLAKAFLKEVSRWRDDEQIHPVDLGRDSPTRARFSDRVIGRSVAAVRSYWQQRIFSGRGLPPPELGSDQEVVRFVEGHRGGVGYVSVRADLGKTKAVAVGD